MSVKIDRIALRNEICDLLKKRRLRLREIAPRIIRKHIKSHNFLESPDFLDNIDNLKRHISAELRDMIDEDNLIIEVDVNWRCHLVSDWEHRVSKIK